MRRKEEKVENDNRNVKKCRSILDEKAPQSKLQSKKLNKWERGILR